MKIKRMMYYGALCLALCAALLAGCGEEEVMEAEGQAAEAATALREPVPVPQAEAQTAGEPERAEGVRQDKKPNVPQKKNAGQAEGSPALKKEPDLAEGRYVGEHADGKPHGRGVVYFKEDDGAGRKSYDGEWVKGVRQGTGTMVWNDGKRYTGEWRDGMRNGQGTEHYPDGSRYEGEWKDDGKVRGTCYLANGDRYEGSFLHDRLHGQGTCYRTDGVRYTGEWRDGMRNGQGTEHYPDGSRYEGEWKDDGKVQGTYYLANGDRYEGSFEHDRLHGQGTHYLANGDYEIGNYVNGKREGRHERYTASGGHKTCTYVDDVLQEPWKDRFRIGAGPEAGYSPAGMFFAGGSVLFKFGEYDDLLNLSFGARCLSYAWSGNGRALQAVQVGFPVRLKFRVVSLGKGRYCHYVAGGASYNLSLSASDGKTGLPRRNNWSTDWETGFAWRHWELGFHYRYDMQPLFNQRGIYIRDQEYYYSVRKGLDNRYVLGVSLTYYFSL